MKKILVLTADAGFGHRSAATAVATALQIKYPNECEVVVNNPLEDTRTPSFLRESQSDYDKIVNNWKGEFFRLLYIGLVLGLVIALYFVGAFTQSITTLARILALCILIGYQAPKIWQLQERLVESHIENKIEQFLKAKEKSN